MLAGGLAIADKRPLALGITIAVGATIRESALFLIPFAYAYWAARPIDTDALKRTAAAGLPGLALYAAIRTGIPTTRNGYGSALDIVERGSRQPAGRAAAHLHRVRAALVRRAVRAAGTSRYARAGLALFACCLLSFLFVRDWGRVVLLAAPAVYVAAAHVLERPAPARDRRRGCLRRARPGLRDLHAGARRGGQHHQRTCARLPGPLGPGPLRHLDARHRLDEEPEQRAGARPA